MRAFKKFMAGMIATAIAATMATSAFAAELSEGKMVLSEGETYTAEGQTTVLVVPYDVWIDDALVGLEGADILYIDQWEDAATANAAIAEGLGVKLNNGELADINSAAGEADYYVLFGEEGNITALECVIGTVEDEPVIAWGDVTGDNIIDNTDAVTLFRHTTGAELLTYSEDELMRICNVDGNTEVNNTDAVTLFRHTTGAEAIAGMGLGTLN